MNERNWPRSGAHGLTLSGQHTFRNWYLVPTEIPEFQPAKPRLEMVDIPGMSGSLDFSEVLGDVTFDRVEGEFHFYMLPHSPLSWTDAKSAIMSIIQGKENRCILDDVPNYYRQGRFWVSEAKQAAAGGYLTISYSVEPFWYALSSTADLDWLWNDLFDTTIYYGTFDVVGEKVRTFINPSGQRLEPTFVCSAPFTVTVDGASYPLHTGSNPNPGFRLLPGESVLTFTGTGRIVADYSLGVRF